MEENVQMELRLEPADAGLPGEHVNAAIGAARAVDEVEVEVSGGTIVISGGLSGVLDALRSAATAALDAGATAVSARLERSST